MTLESFIVLCNKINPNLDFSNSIYVNKTTPVLVKCKLDGYEFFITPKTVQRTNSIICPKCKENSILERIQSINDKIHNSKYQFKDLVPYKGINHNYICICPVHGEFKISLSNFLYHNQGCPKCAKDKQKISLDILIKDANKVHDSKYDYSLIKAENYKNTHQDIQVICPEHGIFVTNFMRHIHSKQGCPKCGIIKRNLSLSDGLDGFKAKAINLNSDRYDYSLIEKYDGQRLKLPIKCNNCGSIFYQTPNRHLAGDGCPYCKKYTLEIKVKEVLESLSLKIIYQWKPEFLKNGKGQKSVDFYLPDYNIVIECQGIQHFKEVEFFRDKLNYTINNDIIKNHILTDLGYSILYVYDNKISSYIQKDNDIFKKIYNDENLLSLNSLNDKIKKLIKLNEYYYNELN